MAGIPPRITAEEETTPKNLNKIKSITTCNTSLLFPFIERLRLIFANKRRRYFAAFKKNEKFHPGSRDQP